MRDHKNAPELLVYNMLAACSPAMVTLDDIDATFGDETWVRIVELLEGKAVSECRWGTDDIAERGPIRNGHIDELTEVFTMKDGWEINVYSNNVLSAFPTHGCSGGGAFVVNW